MSRLTWVDNVVMQFDTALRSLCPPAVRHSARPCPDEGLSNHQMGEAERKHAIGLMRVNHSGEVCAQALYQGQAWLAKDANVRAQLHDAQQEEVEHLAWCESRLKDLNGHVSLLNPIWYLASFVLGAGVGCLGTQISLGFVVEVERQVEAHLASHLSALPQADVRSRAVLAQMKKDEAQHAKSAKQAGGVVFPPLLQHAMKWTAKAMTIGSYYL